MARIPRRRVAACTIGWLLIGAPASLSAQALDDPIERARVQVGPLGLTPSIALTGLGIDSNVFNEFEDPKRDFTFTVSPQLNAWLRAGRSRLQVAARTDLWYFHTYSSERSVDGTVNARFERRGTRVTPWLDGSLVSGRQRFGYEIDRRFRGITRQLGAGVDVRVGGKTRLGVSARRVDYDHEPVDFLGGNLRELLDRRSESIGLQAQYALTPLTTFVVSGARSRDRFQFTPARNADNTRVDAGFDLLPSALIAGRGRVGYRWLTGTGGSLADYAGVVAAVAAGSTIRGRTRLEVATERDVTYSWELFYPYYVLTGVTVTATPQLTRRLDVRGRWGTHRLAYRAAVGIPDLRQDRVDRFKVLGAGVGYRLARDMRVGIDVDRERRRSVEQRRVFEGFRTGISVTYGR